VVGLKNGYIKTFELETGRPDGSYIGHPEDAEVLNVHKHKSKPLFFTADDRGNIFLWVGPPHLNKYQKVFQMQHLNLDKQLPTCITCIVYN